jgi:hypothetical protein
LDMGYLQVLGLIVTHAKLIVLIAVLTLTNVEFVILVMVYHPVEYVFHVLIITVLSVLKMLTFVQLVELIMDNFLGNAYYANPIVLFVLIITCGA